MNIDDMMSESKYKNFQKDMKILTNKQYHNSKNKYKTQRLEISFRPKSEKL